MNTIESVNKLLEIGNNGVHLNSWDVDISAADFNEIKDMIMHDDFDITGFVLIEIPHPLCFCFYNEKTEKSFDIVKFWDDKWQPSYLESTIKGLMNMKAGSIGEAVDKCQLPLT